MPVFVASFERKIAKVRNGDYDPKGRNYLSSLRVDDPFQYQITKRARVYTVSTNETLHYELYGRPVGLLPDWREKMTAKGETRFAKVRSQAHDFDATYYNTEDADDPYVYKLIRVEAWTRGPLVWYEFYGRPIDIKDEWKKVIRAAGGKADTGVVHKQPKPSVETLYAILGVRTGAGQAEIRRAYRTLAFELHPDRNQAPDATKRFQEIQTAYERLMILAG
jgi:DnaJ-domain-containing protein 1